MTYLKTIIVLYEVWPFEIPLVKYGTVWRLDTVAVMEEVVSRRIGRNELSVIDTFRGRVDAQRRFD